jgi:hypothetical protein
MVLDSQVREIRGHHTYFHYKRSSISLNWKEKQVFFTAKVIHEPR